jgi:hypothetical protein
VSDDQPPCRCILCHDYGNRDQRDPVEADTIGNVQQYGWSVIMVPEDNQGPGWAYTIGLWHTHNSAELAMFGLDVTLMKTCLNHLGNQIAAGQPAAADQENHDVIERYPVHLKQIDHRWYKAFFGRAIGFYRRQPIPFLQVVWPDRHGRFPWDADNDPHLQQRQPQLWRRPDEHPQGVWTQDL